jgi:hypothetical protein
MSEALGALMYHPKSKQRLKGSFYLKLSKKRHTLSSLEHCLIAYVLVIAIPDLTLVQYSRSSNMNSTKLPDSIVHGMMSDLFHALDQRTQKSSLTRAVSPFRGTLPCRRQTVS